jgi:ATP-binding protein involved in chromosome partitioning
MPALTKALVTDSLAPVLPAGSLQWVSACDTYASIRVHLPSAAEPPTLNALAAKAKAAIESASAPLDSFIVEYVDSHGSLLHTSRFGAMNPPPPASTGSPAGGHEPIRGLGPTPQPAQQPTQRPGPSAQPTPQQAAGALPGVKHIIAVGAGKGGVGKSTIAVNLAVGLARRGHAVGLMDGDIYGPSLPTLLGLTGLDQSVLQGKLQPFYLHGIKAITIGKLVDAEKPLIWRGPMAHGAFKQLTEQTDWGELDYLVIDLPPGTGDISLTMAQLLQLTGAVVVCTPQKVAQDDAVRAARMFQQLGIEVLGVVENMSYFIADDLSPPREYDIFGRGGAEVMAQRLNLPFLGNVPLTISLRKNSDAGSPTNNFSPASSPLAAALEQLVTNVENQVALTGMRKGATKPSLTIR